MDPCGVWLHHVGRRCWMGLGVYPGRINLRFERGRVIATGVSRNGGQIALDEEFLCRAGYPFEGAEPARQ